MTEIKALCHCERSGAGEYWSTEAMGLLEQVCLVWLVDSSCLSYAY